jgi:transcriptional regulator GlxA family with amidase domain
MSTHKIAIVAMQGVQLLDVIGPSDVFAEANRQSGLDYYAVEVVSTSGSPVRGSSGLALLPDRLIDEEPSEVDTLLVAGDPLIQERPLTENLLRWVKQTSARANREGPSAPELLCSARQVYLPASERPRIGRRHRSLQGVFRM